MRDGLTDLGMTAQPCCRPHLSSTWHKDHGKMRGQGGIKAGGGGLGRLQLTYPLCIRGGHRSSAAFTHVSGSNRICRQSKDAAYLRWRPVDFCSNSLHHGVLQQRTSTKAGVCNHSYACRVCMDG